jgi:ADP-Ribosyltransferase in polyvalent proteins
MKIKTIYNELLTEAIKGGKILAYHGTNHEITSFVDDFVGGEEAKDQEGPGLYFTTSEDDANGYGTFMYKVMLTPRKLLTTSPINRGYLSTIIKLCKMSSNWKETAQNWDENPNRGIIEAANSFIDYNDNEKDLFLQVWIDFYRYKPVEYVRNMVKLGIDGIIIDAYGVNKNTKHIIMYNTSLIKKL